MLKVYEYQHTVTFEETNLIGNVYYTNFLKWQGMCREHFLRDNVDDFLSLLDQGWGIVTTHCSCQYVLELFAFEEVVIRMSLRDQISNRMVMDFEYWRNNDNQAELVATGEQGVAFIDTTKEHGKTNALPKSVAKVIKAYLG